MDMAFGSSVQCTGAVRRFSLRIIRTPHSNLYIVFFWLVRGVYSLGFLQRATKMASGFPRL